MSTQQKMLVRDGSFGEQDDHYIEGAWGTLAEQRDEAFYDDRSDADDDLEKGQIKFPKDKLYGRHRELAQLRNLYVGVENKSKAKAKRNTVFGEYDFSRVVFLAGYRGIGKSALVENLMVQIKSRPRRGFSAMYASGKYREETTAAAPFSAIRDALGMLVSQILNRYPTNSTKVEQDNLLSRVKDNLRMSGTFGRAENAIDTLLAVFPSLAPLFSADNQRDLALQESKKLQLSKEHLESGRFDSNKLHDIFRGFMCALCSSFEDPLFLFLDDMQWADEASLSLLLSLLSDPSLKNIFFIGAYRADEVTSAHPFHDHMSKVSLSRGGNSKAPARSVIHMELFNLSPSDITEFISDSISKETDDIAELSEVVYEKTMGNIQFVIWAMEELVRKNALYYDVMYFDWQWNVSKVELQNYLCSDVIGMVKSKIQGLPSEIQSLLSVMAYIPNNISKSTLQALIDGEGVATRDEQMVFFLRRAVGEGLLSQLTQGGDYCFVHNRIQEASQEMVPKGREREELLVRIANVLVVQGTQHNCQWMFHVAVDHLNSVHPSCVPRIELAKLNLRVAKIALRSGDLAKVNGGLRSGLACLESSEKKWKGEEYGFTLELFNNTIKSEYSAGCYDLAEIAIQEVLSNAQLLGEKNIAQVFSIKCIGGKTNQNYTLVTEKAIEILKLHGQDLPLSPSKKDESSESSQFKIALRKRPISFLSDLLVAESNGVFNIFYIAIMASLHSGNNKLALLAGQRAICLAIKQGISKELAVIVSCVAVVHMRNGHIKLGCDFGNAAMGVSKIFSRERATYDIVQTMIQGCIFPYMHLNHDSSDMFFSSYNSLKSDGDTDMALMAGLSYACHHFSNGHSLSSTVTENRLLTFQELSIYSAKPTYTALFQLTRQFVMNLRKRSDNPTQLRGEAFNEDATLSALGGNARSMTLRDISTFRLQLAFIFHDKVCMREMLEQLANYPQTDQIYGRLQLRLCFVGLAALIMWKEAKNKSHLKLAKCSLQFFKRLKRLGSTSARSVYHFLKAVRKPGKAAFEKAIASCSDANHIHLEAMANEHCGIYFTAKKDHNLSQKYITKAYWLYAEWGAQAKTAQMTVQYVFLKISPKSAPRKKSRTSKMALGMGSE